MNTNKYKMILSVLVSLISLKSMAQELDSAGIEAKKLLERISSTKVSSDHHLVEAMAARIRVGDRRGAAEIATTHPNFLNTTVKLMALKMSTREESIRISLNDFAAMFIGVTRDELDARELLKANYSYRANMAAVPAGVTVRANVVEDMINSNNHFQDLEQVQIDIGQILVQVPGQVLRDGADNVVANPDPAGVLTSRTFMAAHATDGTNRRLVEFTFREFMCVPIEEWADTRASDARIGRDIDRFPGGDHMKFQTSCKGCHTQMDGFRGAFAKWDFQGGRAVNGDMPVRVGNYSAQGVSNKLNKNGSVYAGGFQTTDSTFVNNSRGPANANLFGWRGNSNGGMGVKDLGIMVGNSKRFSQCMVKRVYDAVCRTNLVAKYNLPYLAEQAEKFEQNGYNLKKLFQMVAITPQCSGT